MADGGGEGGGSADWLPIFDRVEAMLSKSQAEAEALAAERARLVAVDRAQRESRERLHRTVEELEAAAREKDDEVFRLRAEAADARKRLREARQADVSRRGRWEAAYVDLLLGANQKLAELRDGDLEDSRTCAETPNPKEVRSCSRLSQSIVDHVGSDLSTELRKLKRSYEAASSKKDREVSALLSEKDSVSNQLRIMQQEYADKKVEAAQATEAALKLQQSVDELKVLAQKKDDEIGRLQAQAVGAEMNLQKAHSLIKEKEDEIQRLIRWDHTSVQKHKDISETQKNSRSDGQDETSQKRRRVSSISNSQTGVPRPHGQLTSASPSASAAAGLVKLKEAEQQPKQEQRLPGLHGQPKRGRGRPKRGRGRGPHHSPCPIVQRQSCDQAEIGGQIEVEGEEKQQPEEEQLQLRGRRGRGRGRGRGWGRYTHPVVQLQSCDQAEIGGQIEVEGEEKQQPEEEQPGGVPQPRGQLPSASAAAAAGLIKLIGVE